MSRNRKPARRPILRLVSSRDDIGRRWLRGSASSHLKPVVSRRGRPRAASTFNVTALIDMSVKALRQDADRVADQLVDWADKWCCGVGGKLTSEQSAQLKVTAYEMLMNLHRIRISGGLRNLDKYISGERDQFGDEIHNIRSGGDHVRTDIVPPQSLLERFRAVLAEDSEPA